MSSGQGRQSWRMVSAFLIGQGISLFGSQVVMMAVIWYVALEASSGLWIAALTLAATVPQVIVSLFAGVWADRYDRKRIIIAADGAIATATLLLALLLMSGALDGAILPALVVASAVRALGGGIHAPAVNALLPQLAPAGELMRVNGFNGSIQSAVQLVSPLAAGALLALGPLHRILFIDVATAAIGIAILAVLRIPRHQPVERAATSSVFAEMKDGLAYAWNHRFLRRLLATYGVYIFLCVPSGFLTTLMIERTFGDNVALLTINETVAFGGMLLGGLILGATGGFKNRVQTFFVGVMLCGVASLAVGFTQVFWLFAALMFVIGLSIPPVQSAVYTLVQEKTSPAMLGRVFSLLAVMFSGFMPLGMLVFGPLADVVRIQTLVIPCAVSTLLLGLSLVLTRDFYSEGLAVSSVAAA